MSKSRHQPYFFNHETQESSWTAPAGLSADELKNLPGGELLSGEQPQEIHCRHLLVKHKDSRRPSSWRDVSTFITFYSFSVPSHSEGFQFIDHTVTYFWRSPPA